MVLVQKSIEKFNLMYYNYSGFLARANAWYKVGEETHTIAQRAEIMNTTHGKATSYLKKHGERIFKY